MVISTALFYEGFTPGIGALKVVSGDEAGGVRIIEGVIDLDVPLADN